MRFEAIRALVHTIHFRLTLWNTLVVFIAVISALIAVRIGVEATLNRETDQRLREDALEIELTIVEFYPNWDLIHEELDRKAEGHRQHGMFVQLLDPAGELTWKSVHSPPATMPVILGAQQSLSMQTVDEYRVAVRRLESTSLPKYRILVGTSLLPDQTAVSNLTHMILFIGGVVLVLSPLGGYWLAGRATAPFAQIHEAAAKLRPSTLSERLPIRGTGDELDRLSETINGLLDRLADYLSKHRQFIANAAHELRSPLAAIQSSVEVALNTDRSTADYQDMLSEIYEECSSLRKLVNELLLLAETDAGAQTGQFEPVQVDDIVKRSVAMFRDAAEEQGVHLELAGCEPATVLGSANQLRQVINNLIDNGIKFNRPGGNVRIELRCGSNGDDVAIQVTDNSYGIAPEDLPHVFERFYRGDRSRSREHATAGNGLGLSICQSILESHGGTISVASEPERGTKFDILLPTYRDDTARNLTRIDKPAEGRQKV